MKKQILFVLSLILGLTTLSFAQTTRTITNTDLEKFRQQREQAAAEYRATYKERGMPSPEELERREAERQKDLAEYAARARVLQQRQAEIEAQTDALRTQNNYAGGQSGETYYNQQPFYYGGQLIYNGGYGNRNYRGIRRGVYTGVQPHTQLSPLLPNVQINRNPIRIFTTPTGSPARIYAPSARGGRIN